MISESEDSKAIDEFTAKIEGDMARFDGFDGKQAKKWSKLDQEQEDNFYEEEMWFRRNENGNEKEICC